MTIDTQNKSGELPPLQVESEGQEWVPLPEWAEFLIRIGRRHVREHQVGGSRFTVVLVPTRLYASHFCALGVSIESAYSPLPPLSWAELSGMAPGSRVFSLGKNKNKLGLREWRVQSTAANGTVIVTSPIKNGSQRVIVRPHTLDELPLYAGSIVRPHRAARRSGTEDFYRALVPHMHSSWVYLSRLECHIVTNRARWIREARGLNVRRANVAGESAITIWDALMPGEANSQEPSRVWLSSPLDDALPSTPKDTPVILDGADAFRVHESLDSERLLILLERSEFSESLEQDLKEWLSCRDDNATIPEPIPEEAVPKSFEVVEFVAGDIQS